MARVTVEELADNSSSIAYTSVKIDALIKPASISLSATTLGLSLPTSKVDLWPPELTKA
jgi:hypothetical protein